MDRPSDRSRSSRADRRSSSMPAATVGRTPATECAQPRGDGSLRFGDRAVGLLLEMEHHKRGTYGPKQLPIVQRIANQLATTLHIHELREAAPRCRRAHGRAGRDVGPLRANAPGRWGECRADRRRDLARDHRGGRPAGSESGCHTRAPRSDDRRRARRQCSRRSEPTRDRCRHRASIDDRHSHRPLGECKGIRR